MCFRIVSVSRINWKIFEKSTTLFLTFPPLIFQKKPKKVKKDPQNQNFNFFSENYSKNCTGINNKILWFRGP